MTGGDASSRADSTRVFARAADHDAASPRAEALERHARTAGQASGLSDRVLAEALWAISLNAAACQRWLACDPPCVEEALKSLDLIGDDAERVVRLSNPNGPGS